MACRQSSARGELLRFVRAPDGSVVLDLRGSLPGRGAWSHPDCLGNAISSKGLARALKGQVDAAQLRERARSVLLRSIREGLSRGAKSGALVGGQERLRQALREGSILELIIANDAAERTVGNLAREAEGVPQTVLPLDTGELGELVGKGSRAALGVTKSRSVADLHWRFSAWRSLAD